MGLDRVHCDQAGWIPLLVSVRQQELYGLFQGLVSADESSERNPPTNQTTEHRITRHERIRPATNPNSGLSEFRLQRPKMEEQSLFLPHIKTTH